MRYVLLVAAVGNDESAAETPSSEVALHTKENTDDLKTLVLENTELTRVVKASTDLLAELQHRLLVLDESRTETDPA